MKRKTVNLVKVFDAELGGPNWSDFGFKLTFRGESPGGQDLAVTVEFPGWAIEYLGQKLHTVLKKQEDFLRQSRTALESGKL